MTLMDYDLFDLLFLLDGCIFIITVHQEISGYHSLNSDLGDDADTKKPDTFIRYRAL